MSIEGVDEFAPNAAEGNLAALLMPERGDAMPVILRITDDSTSDELCEAIGHLRDRQKLVALDATKAEIQREIDVLLDRVFQTLAG